MQWPKWLTSAAALLEEPSVAVEQQKSVTVAEKRKQVQANRVTLKEVPAKYACQVAVRAEEAIRADIEGAKSDIQELERIFNLRSNELLPIEIDAKNLLAKTHSESKAKANRRVQELETDSVTSNLDRRFKRIDMSFLKMCNWSEKNQCPVPMFGIFSVKDPWCRLQLSVQRDSSAPGKYIGRWNDDNKLVQYIDQEFLIRKGADTAERSSRGWASVSAETQFTGVIPASVRELIKEEQGNFEKIYVIAEVNDWDLRVVPAGDPLVIGEKLGRFWFLDMFDTTPSEQFVVDNYTKQMPAQK